MPCAPIPKPPLPSLPAGISLTPPIPQPPALTVPNACCLLPALPITTPPIPLPSIVVNPAFIAGLRAALSAAHDYFDSLPLTCPRS
jgi:hypothetical protein